MSDGPFLLVIAGPNGSGKSTLTDYLITSGVDFGEYINPDQIAADLPLTEPARSRRAQELAEYHRNRCLLGGISFSFETVMSHPSKIEFMVRANDASYDITLFYVCTSNPQINIHRVENRVRLGGHAVPRDRIVARYRRSLDLLASAVLVARRTVLFDNTALVGYLANRQLPHPQTGLRPIAEVLQDRNHYRIALEADAPTWALEYMVQPLQRIVDRSARAISLTITLL